MNFYKYLDIHLDIHSKHFDNRQGNHLVMSKHILCSSPHIDFYSQRDMP